MKQCIRSARCHTVERLSHTFFTGQLRLLEAISGASSQLKRSSLTTRFGVLSGQSKEVAVARFQSAQSEGAAKKLQVHRRGLGAETNGQGFPEEKNNKGSNLGALQSLGPESPCGDERLNSLERRQVRARLQETTFGGNARRGSTTEGVRTVRPTGGKDRHSKVSTAKGLRDRRVRLSAPTAMQFFDVQDRLGFDQPSKAVDWLIKKAKPAIDELEPLAGPGAERAQKGASSKIAVVPGLNKAETNAIPSTMGGGKDDQAAAVEKPGRSVDQKSRSGGESAEQQQGEGGGEATTEAGVEGNKGDSAIGGGRAESRAKARVRARERAKEKSSTSKAMASSNTSSSFLHQLQAAHSSSTIAGAAAAAMQTKMHSSHPFGSMEANDPPPFGSSPPHPNARHHHLPHTLTFLQQTAPDHPQAPAPSIPTHHHLPRLSDLMFLSHQHPQDFPHLELPFPALLERQMMQQQQSALGPDPSPLPLSHAHTAKLELSNSNATGSSSLRLGSTYQFAASPSSLDLLYSSLHSAQLAMFPGAPHLGVMHPPSSTNGNLQAVNPMGPANVHPGSGSLLFPQPIFLNPAAGASQCSFSPSDQHPHREQDLPRELSHPERDVPSSHISSTNNILVNSQAGPGPPLQSSLISTRGTLQSIFSLTSSQPLQPSACQNIAHDYESGFHVMSPGRSMGTSIENSVSRYPARIQGFDEAAEEETRLPSSSLSY